MFELLKVTYANFHTLIKSHISTFWIMCSIEEKIANDDVISILVPLNLK